MNLRSRQPLAAGETGRRQRHESHEEHKEIFLKTRAVRSRVNGGRLAVTEFDPIPAEVEKLGRRAIGCGIAVHRALGPAECVTNVHRRQVISYLRAANLRLGFVFNFNVDVLTEGGIKRVVL